MTYSISLSNGTPLPIVNDSVKDNTTTSINLVGKNYANYGIVLNENFVHILENFSNVTAPANPLEGQLWWNSSAKNLRAYTGNSWKSIISTSVGATQPPAPSPGDQWFNTTAGQLNLWDGTKWLNLGPQASTLTGLNGAVAEAISDTGNPPQTHVVIKHYINDVVVSIDSKDSVFTPAIAIAGFSTIAPGINVSSAYATPTSNISLVSKQYVDSAISGIPTFSLADGTVTPAKLSAGAPHWLTTGNVGIGTLTPTQKLTVAGIVESTSGGFKFPDGTLQTTATTTTITNIGPITPDMLSVGGPYWSTTGNVGVGTTNPDQKLTVDGVIKTTVGVKFPDGTLQTTATVQAPVATVPIGAIIMWAGALIPNGWALCDGTNGTPDLRDRFIVGAGSTYSVSATGGSKDAVVVSHTHTVTLDSNGGHTHSGSYLVQDGTGAPLKGDPSGSPVNYNGTIPTSGTHTHNATVSTTGTSASNANLPPYYALAFIMKVS